MHPLSCIESLPDDIILDITEKLTTARDVARLGAASRHLHHFVQHTGWRTFCRSSFSPILDSGASTAAAAAASAVSGSNPAPRWDVVADRLSYLDRCWEKRGLLIHRYQESQRGQAQRGQGGRNQRRFVGRQNVSFHPVLDAGILPNSSSELVAWGVGEELITKQGPSYGAGLETWNRLEGHKSGYSGGFGDVTAVSIIHRSSRPEIVVGRANGDLNVVVASGDEFGTKSQLLLASQKSQPPQKEATGRQKSPARVAISWTEWQESTKMLASCRHSSLSLYDLSSSDDQNLHPVALYDLSRDNPLDEIPFVRSAKFLSKDTVVCALGGTRTPLRWGRIRPTGLEFVDAAQDLSQYSHFDDIVRSGGNEKTTVRAIETVGHGHSESLLLSAWEDGTYRLNDVRTPSPYDAMYRDRWGVYDAASSLLVYGTQRFVAGSNNSESLNFFDFRNPKPYHHTTVSACSTKSPYPNPPGPRSEPTSSLYDDECSDFSGRSCRWHAESTRDYYRPDAILHFGQSRHDRVHALAKASNLSSSFYCGVDGYILEFGLKLAEDVSANTKRSAPAGWQAFRPRDKVSLVESGVSVVRGRDWEQLDGDLPDLLNQQRSDPGKHKSPLRQRRDCHRRLDTAYRHPSDMSK